MPEAKREIKSLIFRKYDSEAACAESLGWPRQRLNKIVNGKKEPSVSEVVNIAKVLDESVDSICSIFLRM